MNRNPSITGFLIGDYRTSTCRSSDSCELLSCRIIGRSRSATCTLTFGQNTTLASGTASAIHLRAPNLILETMLGHITVKHRTLFILPEAVAAYSPSICHHRCTWNNWPGRCVSPQRSPSSLAAPGRAPRSQLRAGRYYLW
jgi:hypothetical protein